MKTLSSYPRAWWALVGLFAAAMSAWAAGPQAYLADEVDEPARLRKPVAPAYPSELKQAGVNGSVMVEFLVSRGGRVTRAFAVEADDSPFAQSAVKAALQWEFRPARKDGQSVDCWHQQRMQFTAGPGGGTPAPAVKSKGHEDLPLEMRWDKGPIVKSSAYPVYPAAAFLKQQPGRAVVQFVVNQKGEAQTTKVLEASAEEFGGAAVAAAEVRSYVPATRADQPCLALVQREYVFDPVSGGSVPGSEGLRKVVKELGQEKPRIFSLTELDAPLEAILRRPPVYPSALRETGQTGEAVIECYIDGKGIVYLPRIVSATVPEFGYAAAQAVARWRFEPPLKKGKPVIVRTRVPVAFQLQANVEVKIVPPNELKP